ncbi:MAG: hypothetical protein HZA84_07165 [Thaumarchaeota archaeon]|nr:hypothetical protein [Nitrososphaerota archaeon]
MSLPTESAEIIFGDGTTYKKKGDRCSCICHRSENYEYACRLCQDEC